MNASKWKKVANYQYDEANPIGSGSYGKVFKCIDLNNSEKSLAIKVLNKQQVNNDNMQECVVTEINVGAKLKCKHVVALESYFKTSNHVYMIMEYCGGGSLSDKLKPKKPLGIREAISITKQIASVFYDENHYRLIKNTNGEYGRFLHRDLKPENILFNEGEAKVSDFGLSKILENPYAYSTNTQCGTPVYMCPEMQQSEIYTQKCDVWSMGIILYQMIFGEPPYKFSLTPQIGIMKKNTIDKIMETKGSEYDIVRPLLVGMMQFEQHNRFSWEQVYQEIEKIQQEFKVIENHTQIVEENKDNGGNIKPNHQNTENLQSEDHQIQEIPQKNSSQEKSKEKLQQQQLNANSEALQYPEFDGGEIYNFNPYQPVNKNPSPIPLEVDKVIIENKEGNPAETKDKKCCIF